MQILENLMFEIIVVFCDYISYSLIKKRIISKFNEIKKTEDCDRIITTYTIQSSDVLFKCYLSTGKLNKL